MKYLLLLPALLLAAIPAEAHRRNDISHINHSPEYRLVCDQHGCSVRLKQPKVRVSSNCVLKPWSNRTVCRY